MRPGAPNPLEIVWHSLPDAKARPEATQCRSPSPGPEGHTGARTSVLPMSCQGLRDITVPADT